MRLILDYKLRNWNDIINVNRTNKNYANICKKKEMATIRKLLKGIEPIKNYPVRLICTWHIRNMISDLDNKSIKSLLDTLQLMGVLENDNCKHISEIVYKFEKDTKDYLIVDIEEVNNAYRKD